MSQSNPNPEDSRSESLAAEDQFYKPKSKRSVDESQTTRKNLPPSERVRLFCKSIVDSAFRRELPLQSETSYFILANVLDFYMTYLLLSNGAIESNPVADFFYKNWGFQGMLYFKLLSVAFICVLAQAIARRSLNHARFVLLIGTAIVGFVVVYSGWLLYTRVL
ncbi:MAG: DUF5658 family protein [Planctomycetota bacterium]